MRKKMGIGIAAAACFVLCVACVCLYAFSHGSKEGVKFTDELKLNAYHDIDGTVADGIVNHKLVDTTNWAMSVIDETFAGHGREMSGEERRGVEIAARNLFYELFNGNVLQRDENGKLTDLSKAYVANVLSEAVVANVDGMDAEELLDAGGSMYTQVLDISETMETVKKNEETLCGLAWDINDLMILLSGNPASGIDENDITRKLRAFQTNLLTLAYEKNPSDGNNGLNGINGTAGGNGYNGIDGMNGVNGTAGGNGYNGIDGINGVNGNNGIDGKNGNTGTAGKDGTAGQNGATGTNGINGSNGTNGTNGNNGTNGKNGNTGTNGSNGKDGKNGTNGTNGSKGTNGTNGTNGIKGSNGTDGKNGTNGTDGRNGTNGIDGINGTDGKNGTNGTNGRDGMADVETVKKLQDTVNELSKAQVGIISDMRAAMSTIDSLTKDVAVGEKSDNSIKKDVSEINESLGKAEASITETGVKLASLEKSITADYEKKIDKESKSLVARIDSTVAAAKESFEEKFTGLGDIVKKNKTETDKLIADAKSDTGAEFQKYKSSISAELSTVDKAIKDLGDTVSETRAELANTEASLKTEFTNADEQIKTELSGEVANLKQTLQSELSETNSDISVLKESIRDYMMSSEGHAKVDVLKDIVILKQGENAENESNTFYWELSGGKAYTVISSPYLKDCMSVQVYYRYQENISPVYEVDEESGKLTIFVNESDLERVDRVEIQSMLIIHNADESTLNEDNGVEVRSGYTSENTPDLVQMDAMDIDADGISHESGDNIVYTVE